MKTVLVLGYGNALRGDDAAGPLAAEAIAAQALPGVEVRVLHQLLPELAQPIAAADLVVFIDAAVDVEDGDMLRIQEIRPAIGSTAHGTHISTPTDLLAMARDLFSALPRAVLVSIPAETFEFGAALSERTRQGVAHVISQFTLQISD